MFFAGLPTLTAAIGAWNAPSYLSGVSGPVPIARLVSPGTVPDAESDTLTVMTLNLAHGRSDGLHQLLTSTHTIKENLDEAAALVVREGPDVVALQEADGPSVWSGSFDHVARLADEAGVSYRTRGAHVQALGLSYGTAIISRLPLLEAVSHTFRATPPTPTKGFVRVSVPTADGQVVDVVSVHLDFARGAARQKQIAQLVAALQDRDNPLVVLGDFNCGWSSGSALQTLADALDLRAYAPDEDAPTFGDHKRLDWVLISEGLDFIEHHTLSDVVSDHRAVVATLRVL